MTQPRAVRADDAVVYCAEGRQKGIEYSGPFDARVLKVYEQDELSRIDLEVTYAPGVLRTKTGVPYSEALQKHRWSWPPRE